MELEQRVEVELTKKLSEATMPFYTDVAKFMFFILRTMRVTAESSKTVCMLTLIYLERLIMSINKVNVNSFNKPSYSSTSPP